MTLTCENYPNEIRFVARIFRRLEYLIRSGGDGVNAINSVGLEQCVYDLIQDTVWTQPQPCDASMTDAIFYDIVVEQLEFEAENRKNDQDEPLAEIWAFINSEGVPGLDWVWETFGQELDDMFEEWADEMASAYEISM